MISALSLILIVPASIVVGAFIAFLITAHSIRNMEIEVKKAYKQGLQDGMRFML